MTKSEVVNKLKTLTQGQYSESVISKMGTTFTALCSLADFSSELGEQNKPEIDNSEKNNKDTDQNDDCIENRSNTKNSKQGLTIDGLVYNIQLILPESRDPKVYDVLFESLKKHLS